MRPINTPTFVGPSGQHTRFIVAAEYKQDGLFSGVRVTVMQHGDKRDLTKANLIWSLGALRDIYAKDNESLLQKLSYSPLVTPNSSRPGHASIEDVVLGFEGDEAYSANGEQKRFRKNLETIEIIHEYIRLLHEDTNLKFNIPSTQSKTMCVIS